MDKAQTKKIEQSSNQDVRFVYAFFKELARAIDKTGVRTKSYNYRHCLDDIMQCKNEFADKGEYGNFAEVANRANKSKLSRLEEKKQSLFEQVGLLDTLTLSLCGLDSNEKQEEFDDLLNMIESRLEVSFNRFDNGCYAGFPKPKSTSLLYRDRLYNILTNAKLLD